MDLDYGPEYEDFRKEVRDFCRKYQGLEFSDSLGSRLGAGKKSENINSLTMTRSEWQKILIEQGYFAREIPSEYGGYGGSIDILKNKIINSEFAKAGVPPATRGQGTDYLVPTLLEMGTEEQKQKYIRPTLHFEMIWCQGYSEPNSGSDLASLQTKGVIDGDSWVINGQKIWTSTAKYAHMMFCLVRTEPDAPKHKGISYLLIPMDTPGIEIRPLVDMTLDAGFNEVFFTDVRIPAGNIVGERGQGWLVANKTLVHERGSLGDPTAIVSRMNQLIELMKSETLDGTRIIDKPVFRDRVMKIQGRVLAFQNHGLRLLSARLNNRKDAMFGIMILKLIGTELRHELEGLAIDVMGELGTLYQDSPNLRDNGSWQFAYMMYLGLIIGGGTNQIQKNIIAERGLGLPKAPKIKEA
ncbi:MAG: acyl-CoA dehydrogenase [Gammaproteobacteria bacterium]|nr:acyl-CoA dehydrogenase [Gammaproteobacteria bacterium]|tara:strand:+ start:663 stop:1895 length:1233 start_codon:yes stop_codon:yes gene_type:complete